MGFERYLTIWVALAIVAGCSRWGRCPGSAGKRYSRFEICTGVHSGRDP